MTNPYAEAAAGMAGEAPRNPYASAASGLAEERRTQVRTNAYAAGATSPAQAASDARIGREAGIPPDVVSRNRDAVQRRLTADRIDADTAQAPLLRERYADPQFAAVAADDSKPLSFFERITSAFRRGLTSSQQGADASVVKESADILNVIDRIQRGELATDADLARATPYASMFAGAGRSPEALAAARARAEQSLAENAAEFMTRADRLQRLPIGADYARFQESKTWGDAFSRFVDAPVSISSQILSQSTGTMLPAIPLIVASGLAGGAPALAATTGGSSFVAEYTTGLADAFNTLGVDPRDRKAVLAAVRSPEFAELNRQAMVKAGVIGAFDAATAGVAGVRLATRPVANVAAQVGVQAAGGAGGEAAGSVASGQEVNPAAVLAEAFGEGPGAVVDVATLAGRRVIQQRAVAQQAVADAGQLTEIIQAADATALKTRDPETFADLVQRVQPEATVYVAPEHLAGVDLSAAPAVAEQVAEAEATGGDVQIRLSELVAHLPGEQLVANLRTEPEAMTLTEAQAFDPAAQLVQALSTPRMEAALIVSPEDVGMATADWDAYQAASAEAAQAAIDAREARTLRDLQWLDNAKSQAAATLRREAAVARGIIKLEAEQEIRQQPAYAVQRWLKTGAMPDGTQTTGAKLQTSALREMYGDGPAAPWRYIAANMLTNELGLHPDVVAEMFGYSSGDAMVRDIVAARPEADVVAEISDDRLADQFPDIADAVSRERTAEAMVADRARERFLATEAAALAKAVGNRVLLAQEARAYAQESIANRKILNARPAQFKASADRAGRQAQEAFTRGDTALAAKYKQSQVLQTSMQTEATAATTEVSQALASFKRMARADDGSRDGNLANAARAILSEYGLANTERNAADYLAQVKNYDPDLHADLLALMDGMPAPVSDYREMTVGDFRTMRDRVQAIWTLARTTREIEIDGQRVQLDEAAGELAQQLSQEPAAKREKMVGTNNRLDLRMRLVGLRAGLRRVEFWADARDRGDKNGPFRRFVWQPVSEAVTRYRDHRNEYVTRFLALLKTIEPTLKPGKIEAPELGEGMVFADRSALLHSLLHLGNESNRRKLLLGYQWATLAEDGTVDSSRWDAFMNRMHAEGRITQADWTFVQSVWDLLEAMKPAAQAAHKRMFGHYFSEITANPVQTPFGELAGGYVPAITDALLVPEARAHGAMDDLLAGQNAPMFPAVARGFTKSRVENYTRPLALDLRQLPAHIDKVSRFSTLGPVLRDSARLLTRNKTFRGAMDAVDPTAIESLLTPWLKRTAAQTLNKAPESTTGRAVARIASTVRNRTGLLLMAGNVVNTLQQITGLSVAALRVKPRHLVGAMFEILHSPRELARSVDELSPWMRQRGDDGARDIDRQINDLLLNPGPVAKVEAFASRWGYVLQQVAQNFVDRVVWMGAYRQAEAEGVSDAQAVRDADSAVRMTQSSFAPEDATGVEHAPAFTRLFLMFYSYFSGQFNLLATEVSNARSDPARMAYVYLMGFAIPAFMADVLAKGMSGDLGDDEDGDELANQLLQSFFLSQARYSLGMVPVAGQAGNALIGQFTPERFDDRMGASPTYSAIESTLRAPRSIYRAMNDEGNPKTAVRDGLAALQVLTGIPTGVVMRPLGYLADENREDLTARGLVAGR